MIYLLDTNVCIRYLNGKSESVRQRIESLHSENIALCSVVKAELFYGAIKSFQSERNIAKLRKFADRFISFSFDDTVAEKYGEIRCQLEKSGTPIGPNDMMITAVAVQNNAVLVTNNTREFSKVKGLKIEDWEE